MQKGRCYIALTISVVVFICFLADLVMGLAGSPNLAPFKYANLTIDIVFVVCSLFIGIMSFFTLREQV